MTAETVGSMHLTLLTVLQVSLSEDSIRENIGAFIDALLRAKPAGLKKG